MGFFYFTFQDWEANKKNTKGRAVAVFFRIANYANKSKLFKIILLPYLIFYKLIFEYLIGFEVPYNTTIGKGLCIYHLQAIVINKNSIIGKNCCIRHSLTIGNKGMNGECPVIGDNVNIGAQVVILGAISVGNRAIIGAGSVIVKDVPEQCVVGGNPAKVIKNLNL
ncbi:putative colanic acid biosynthesis acetyltransferase WcaB [bacterium A37T11]|nr:putative colanic acid biosynthesis acetyltransferase WcaB [bacterium A37T11]